MSMTFDTKIAIILRDDVEQWQALNITAFLSSAIAGADPDVIGEDYIDADDNHYLPMFIQPVMVFQADAAGIRKAYERAMSREIPIAIFTEELFATGNDIDNRGAVRPVPADDLNLVGFALRAKKKPVDKVLKGLKLHP